MYKRFAAMIKCFAPMRHVRLYGVVFIACIGVLLFIWSRAVDIQAVFTMAPREMLLIAHAGGGLPEGVYSNTREALDSSVDSGFSLIEVDISVTKNGNLVLAHDWDIRHYQYFSVLPSLPSSIAEAMPRQAETAESFKQRRMNYDLTPMSLDDLIGWLALHPDIRIVVDAKVDSQLILASLLARVEESAHPDSIRQFIPQIYDFDGFDAVRALGFTDIIFTNYRAARSASEIADFAADHKLFAITIPLRDVSSSAISLLGQADVPVCTHTVNHLPEARALGKIGISCLYTDYLTPIRQLPGGEG